MKRLCVAVSLAALAAFAGCSGEPRCSGAAGHLCVRIDSTALKTQPDELSVIATAQLPQSQVMKSDRFAVADVFMTRRQFIYEIDLSGTTAVKLSIQVNALRGGGSIGGATRDGILRGAGEITLPLAPTGGGDIDMATPDLSGTDATNPPDMTTRDLRTPVATIGSGLFGQAADLCWNGSLIFVTDRTNNKIFGFGPAAVLNSGTAPTVTLQYADPSDAMPSRTAFSAPIGVWCDGQGLAVADSGNHRVLYFAGANLTATSKAAGVFGQDTLVSGLAANRGMSSPSNLSLRTPYGVHYDGTTLFIADRNNHRVLGVPVLRAQMANLSARAATIRLGQALFTTATAGAGNSGINGPESVAIDPLSGQIAVADSGNHRVAIYATPQILTDGTAATLQAALGQPGLGTNTAGFGAAQLRNPTLVRGLDGNVFVSDLGNNRLQIFSGGLPMTSGASASEVVGADTPAMVGSDSVLKPGGMLVLTSGQGTFLLVVHAGSPAKQSAVLVYRLR